ncbi:type II toxin-antitoxin system prevent-host-death family antitoxin [Methylomagnum sp.]
MLQIDVEKLPTYRMGLKKGEMLGEERGRQLGRQEGAHDVSVAVAKNMLAKGEHIKLIAECVGLKISEIERLQSETPDNPTSDALSIMQTITLAEAETRFSEIIEQASAGEEIIIEKDGKPFVKVVAVSQPELPPRVLGLGRGKFKIVEDFNTMEAEIIRATFEQD